MPANFSTDPNVKEALQEAIADTITGVQKEHVTILDITSGRRLLQLQSDARRLATDVTVRYEINLPATHSGPPITLASIDTNTLKNHINTKFTNKGIAATVSSLQVMSLTSAPVTTTSTTLSRARGDASGACRTSSLGLPTALLHMMGIVCVLGTLLSCKLEL